MGNASILYVVVKLPIINTEELIIMVKFNIEELLKKNNRSKYWLCQQMNITSRNMNRLIKGETTSISFKYLQQFCKLLECTPNDLITIIDDKDK